MLVKYTGTDDLLELTPVGSNQPLLFPKNTWVNIPDSFYYALSGIQDLTLNWTQSTPAPTGPSSRIHANDVDLSLTQVYHFPNGVLTVADALDYLVAYYNRQTYITGHFVSFNDTNLNTGVLNVPHPLDTENVVVEVYDNNKVKIIPDTVTVTGTNNVSINLSSYGTIIGNWTVILLSGNPNYNNVSSQINIGSIFLADQVSDPVAQLNGCQIYSKAGAMYIEDPNGTVSRISIGNRSQVGIAGTPDFLSSTFFQEGTDIEIKNACITVTQLANNINATAIGFDAAKVGGKTVNDAGSDNTVLWTAQKIQNYTGYGKSTIKYQHPIIDVQIDANLDPTFTPTLGDRYILTDVLNLHGNFGTIAGVVNNDIVEYNGSVFIVVFTTTANGEGTFTWNLTTNTWLQFNGTWQIYHLLSDTQYTSLVNRTDNYNTYHTNVNYTATYTDEKIIIDSTNNTVDITLPAITMKKEYVIKVGTYVNAISVIPTTALIDGAASKSLTVVNESIRVWNDNANWYIG